MLAVGDGPSRALHSHRTVPGVRATAGRPGARLTAVRLTLELRKQEGDYDNLTRRVRRPEYRSKP